MKKMYLPEDIKARFKFISNKSVRRNNSSETSCLVFFVTTGSRGILTTTYLQAAIQIK